ncbi:MAG: hypothetical protein ACR5LD_07635 [Symbiopectobacterium sp.]
MRSARASRCHSVVGPLLFAAFASAKLPPRHGVAIFGRKIEHLLMTGDNHLDGQHRTERRALLRVNQLRRRNASSQRLVSSGRWRHPRQIGKIKQRGSSAIACSANLAARVR